MIYLKKGQTLFDNPGMVVYGPTGYYNDGDVVICALSYEPEEPACGYEAKFIAYGSMVYGITDSNKLMEEILKIDPESLLGKTNEDVVVDNLIEEIKTVENPTPELTQDVVDENNANVDNGDTTTTDTTDTTDTTANETVETTTEIDENGDVITTTTTTTTEEIIPEVLPTEPAIEIPVAEPDIQVGPEIIIPSPTDQIVSKLKRIKKIV